MFEKIAYAAAGATAPQPNPAFSFLPLVLLIVVFYFLLIRPQQKRQKETETMIQSLKKGDRIITVGGIIGTITSIQNDYIVIKVGEGETKMEILKTAVSGLRTKQE